MGSTRREIRKDLEIVRSILRRWDPLQVDADEPGSLTRDEYDSYAPQVFGMLRRGATVEELAAHLGTIRTITIGLCGGIVGDRIAAKRVGSLVGESPVSFYTVVSMSSVHNAIDV